MVNTTGDRERDRQFKQRAQIRGFGDDLEEFILGNIDADELREDLVPQQEAVLDWFMREVEQHDEENEPDDSSDSSGSKVDRAISLAEDRATFFHDTTDTGYAAVESGERREILKINSKRFKQWISHQFWQAEGDNLRGEDHNTVISNLSGRAVFDGQRIELHNRVARHDGAVWYDLADKQNRAVRIDEDGWTVTTPPILFRRYEHQQAQVHPAEGDADLDALFDILNPCLDEDQRLLFKVQLIANFIPGFPHPIICPHGPQGSAKTFMCKVMRELIDPSELETLQYTTNMAELTQKVSHHWFVPFDNITNLPQKVSDFFCRAVTGQGFSKRELYTDDADIIYSFQRPIGLNGINTVPQKADLLDRTILYELERIPKEDRKTEDTLVRRLEEMKPAVLADVFDTISEAMRIKDDVELDWKPRMADFAEWGEAIARALGHADNEFLRAYQENIDSGNVEAIEAHILGEAVLAMMDERTEWKDTASATLEELNRVAEEKSINTNQKAWPGGPQWVWRRLQEIKPNLEEVGLHVSKQREGDAGSRLIVLEWSRDVSTDSAVSEEEVSDSTDTTDSTTSSLESPSYAEVVNKVEELGDGRNDPVSYETVLDAFPDKNTDQVENVLERALSEGDLYEPKQGGVARI